MASLKPGDAAPEFSLPSAEGRPVALKELRGTKLVLFFYPKDDTPGCTKEACSFRDNLGRIRKKGAQVAGVSPDPVASHRTFSDKFELPFLLLSDEKKDVVKAYHVWKKKSFMGKTYMGVERTTFIIDERGNISHIFPKVKVDGHVDEVLQCLG